MLTQSEANIYVTLCWLKGLWIDGFNGANDNLLVYTTFKIYKYQPYFKYNRGSQTIVYCTPIK